MTADTFELSTAADVLAAERQAAEAEELASKLEAAVASGVEPVTVEEAAAQRKIIRLAQSRGQSLRERAARYTRAARSARLRLT